MDDYALEYVEDDSLVPETESGAENAPVERLEVPNDVSGEESGSNGSEDVESESVEDVPQEVEPEREAMAVDEYSPADYAGLVYEVRATQSQVDTAKQALSILCTEGLVLIVVVSVCAGLIGWRCFSGRWV